MTFYDKDNNCYNDYNKYKDKITTVIERVLADDTIMSHIQSGEAMLLFDFSVEDCPISIDDSTIYGKINKYFSKIKLILLFIQQQLLKFENVKMTNN